MVELYQYDGLDRIVSFKRGELNGTNDDIPTTSHSQTWTYDALGNQTVNVNKQNQLTGNNLYDKNGNHA